MMLFKPQRIRAPVTNRPFTVWQALRAAIKSGALYTLVHYQTVASLAHVSGVTAVIIGGVSYEES